MRCCRAAAILLVVLCGLGLTLGAKAAPAPGATYGNDFAAFAREVDEKYGLPQGSWAPGKGSGGQLEVGRAQVAQR